MLHNPSEHTEAIVIGSVECAPGFACAQEVREVKRSEVRGQGSYHHRKVLTGRLLALSACVCVAIAPYNVKAPPARTVIETALARYKRLRGPLAGLACALRGIVLLAEEASPIVAAQPVSR